MGSNWDEDARELIAAAAALARTFVRVDRVIDFAPDDTANGDNHDQDSTKDNLLPRLQIEHQMRKAEARNSGENVF